jgi:uncharacterized protein YndB with AHSA1/START domain
VPEVTHSMFRVLIRGSVEQVWNEITRTDEPIAAFFNNRMHVGELKPGSRLAMRTADGKWTGVVGKILEVVPLKRFSHSFRFTAYDDPECVVIYEIEEAEGGVQFTLTIENLPAGTKTAKNMVQGGTMITNTLKSVIETGRPSFGMRMLYTLFKVMAPFSPKRCLSEHWPIDGEGAPAANDSSEDGASKPGGGA